MPSRELEAAIAAAQLTETGLCARCQEHGGLCASCAAEDRAILPQLAVPPWIKLIGVTKPVDPPAPAESPEGRKIRLRKERRRSELARKVA